MPMLSMVFAIAALFAVVAMVVHLGFSFVCKRFWGVKLVEYEGYRVIAFLVAVAGGTLFMGLQLMVYLNFANAKAYEVRVQSMDAKEQSLTLPVQLQSFDRAELVAQLKAPRAAGDRTGCHRDEVFAPLLAEKLTLSEYLAFKGDAFEAWYLLRCDYTADAAESRASLQSVSKKMPLVYAMGKAIYELAYRHYGGGDADVEHLESLEKGLARLKGGTNINATGSSK